MERLGYKIKLIHNKFKFESERNEVFQNSLLTRTEFMVLRYVLLQDKLTCMRDIQEAFNINRSTASELLSSIENKKCVEKIVNENDCRIKYIHVTELGKNEFDKIIKEYRCIEKDFVSGLSIEETNTLHALLDKIIESEYFKKGEFNERCEKRKN